MVQNLQCDWLLSVHYNTTMHTARCFFVSFVSCLLGDQCDQIYCSVVFIHKLQYNAGKNSMKMK